MGRRPPRRRTSKTTIEVVSPIAMSPAPRIDQIGTLASGGTGRASGSGPATSGTGCGRCSLADVYGKVVARAISKFSADSSTGVKEPSTVYWLDGSLVQYTVAAGGPSAG